MATKKKKRKAIASNDGTPIGTIVFGERDISIEDWVKKQNIGHQSRTLNYLLPLFACTVVATFVLIFLKGSGHIILSDGFMQWLGGATISEVAGMLLIIVRKLWS